MVKECFYIAQYPVRWMLKALYTSPPGRTVHSNINSTSLGSILVMQQYSLTFPPLSIASYSFKQLSQLVRRGGNKNAQSKR